MGATLRNAMWTTEVCTQVVTTKELREILLHTEGTIFVAGEIRRLVSTRIGPGVYRISKAPLDGKCPFCGSPSKEKP